MRGALLVSLLVCASSCQKPSPTVSSGAPPPASVGTLPSKPKAVASERAVQDAQKGVPVPDQAKIPFDFPVVETLAKPGDHVLAPPRSFLDDALEGGAEHQTFIYYGGILKERGQFVSEVETLTHQIVTLPNSLIIAIRPGEAAAPGDIVLTSWASGSGMQRAIVVEGGAAKEPLVRYLDMNLENPSGWGKKTDRLGANTFHKLTKAGEVGTTVVCKRDGRPTRQVVVRRAGSRVLGLGFAGKLRAWSDPDCHPLPIRPKLKVGEEIFVPLFAGFVKATVKRVEPEIGRVFARYSVGDQKQEEGFSLLEVATKLP